VRCNDVAAPVVLELGNQVLVMLGIVALGLVHYKCNQGLGQLGIVTFVLPTTINQDANEVLVALCLVVLS